MTDVLMFPGQGSQRAGMGGALFGRYRELTEQASDILGWDVRRLCLEDPDGLLEDTRYTQPAVFVVNALTYRSMRAERTHMRAWPDLALGHSLGEYNALEAAGVLSFPDSVRLVAARAGRDSGRSPFRPPRFPRDLQLRSTALPTRRLPSRPGRAPPPSRALARVDSVDHRPSFRRPVLGRGRAGLPAADDPSDQSRARASPQRRRRDPAADPNGVPLHSWE